MPAPTKCKDCKFHSNGKCIVSHPVWTPMFTAPTNYSCAVAKFPTVDPEQLACGEAK